MSSFAIIIPCYNEEKRLNKEAYSRFISRYPDIQLFFVNDGSTDKTADIITGIISGFSNGELINLRSNSGKAEAIRHGLKKALQLSSFDYIGYLDADLSTSLEEYLELYTYTVQNNVDFIFGSRIQKLGSVIERSFLRHIIGRTLVTLIDKKFRLGYYDTQCGAKIFKSSLLKNATEKPFFTKWFFDVELFLRLRDEDKNYLGVEYPLKNWHNKKGSKLNLLSFPAISKEIFVLLSKY